MRYSSISPSHSLWRFFLRLSVVFLHNWSQNSTEVLSKSQVASRVGRKFNSWFCFFIYLNCLYRCFIDGLGHFEIAIRSTSYFLSLILSHLVRLFPSMVQREPSTQFNIAEQFMTPKFLITQLWTFVLLIYLYMLSLIALNNQELSKNGPVFSKFGTLS